MVMRKIIYLNCKLVNFTLVIELHHLNIGDYFNISYNIFQENELSLTENLRRSVMKKIDKLLTNQVAVATSFENVYNNLTEFPKVAIEVRTFAYPNKSIIFN